MNRLVALVLAAAALAAAPVAQAALPGQNGKLVFHAYALDSPEAGDEEVFTIGPDGSGLARLTDNSSVNDYDPAFSPDGRTIAFTQFPEAASRGRLALMDPDGGNLRTPGHEAHAPAWSPDGHTLVFTNLLSFNYDLFTLDLEGGAPVQLTQSGSDDGAPAWSPDGNTIAFASNFGTISYESEIYSMKSDASEDWVRLTSTFGKDTFPDWSPDGKKIAFVSGRDGNDEIYVMNSDGSGETRLTASPDVDMRPEWSPDGKKIAFVRYSVFDLDAEIWTMRPDGSGQEQLTENGLFEYLGDWQPVPNRPPDCSGAEASPGQIAKHNRTFATVAVGGAGDPDKDPVSIAITGVTQDEPVGAQPDARAGETPETVRLRAERDNRGDGRVYRVAFEARDGYGGSCEGTVTVTVPRRKHVAVVDSAPPSYDSFGT